MKQVVWDSKKLDKLKSQQPTADAKKAMYQKYVWQKYGRLTVLAVKQKVGRSPRMATCVCECGRIVEKKLCDVYSKTAYSCGDPDCGYSQQSKAKRDEFDGVPYIVALLKPKYKCPYPNETCLRSNVCRICCLECDKPCKACANRPEKCGAKKRWRARLEQEQNKRNGNET